MKRDRAERRPPRYVDDTGRKIVIFLERCDYQRFVYVLTTRFVWDSLVCERLMSNNVSSLSRLGYVIISDNKVAMAIDTNDGDS